MFFNKTKTLSGEQAKKNYELDKSIVLLDVRTTEEFKSEKIVGSINIPHDEISKISTSVTNKDQTIYAYCLGGMRAEKAAVELAKMGYTNVYNIGGIKALPFDKIR